MLPKEKHLMSKPSHIAYIVIEPKDAAKNKIWRRVGSVWPHSKGGGFDVTIDPQISVTGRITCTVPKEDDETPGSA
jgi:hypothetical protein